MLFTLVLTNISSPLRERLHALLQEARQLDDHATEPRVAAGEVLLAAGFATRVGVAESMGLDFRLAELLISMAAGARMRENGVRRFPAAEPARRRDWRTIS
jgi:hypothetical protein